MDLNPEASDEFIEECYQSACRALEAAPTEPVIIADGTSSSAALAYADITEKKGFEFVSKGNSGCEDPVGTLFFFMEPTAAHEASVCHAFLGAERWVNCAGAASLTGLPGDLLHNGGSTRCHDATGGFREPDSSLFLAASTSEKPTAVAEVAHAQSLGALLSRLTLWTSPEGPGPARVALGVKIHDRNANGHGADGDRTPPRIDVYLQLAGQQRPSAMVRCGAGSGCVAPCMYEHTLFLSVDDLLWGAPRRTRVLVSAVLAVLVPLYSVLWGGIHAIVDVACGRRSVLHVAGACVRSLHGP